jgi:hypothetical protein
MRKLTATLSAAAMIAATAVLALQTAASAAPFPHSDAGLAAQIASETHPGLSFTTRIISYTPLGFSSGTPSAGDGYVIAGRITLSGVPYGLGTAHCIFTDTHGPVLRVCTVDYSLDNGLIVTDGFINGPGQDAPVTLVVVGGTGAYADAQGYGTLQPTKAGSDVTLHLTG